MQPADTDFDDGGTPAFRRQIDDRLYEEQMRATLARQAPRTHIRQQPPVPRSTGIFRKPNLIERAFAWPLLLPVAVTVGYILGAATTIAVGIIVGAFR